MGGRPGAGTRQARRGRARSPDRNLPHCRAVKVVQAVDVVLHTRLVGLDRCNTWRRAGGGGVDIRGGVEGRGRGGAPKPPRDVSETPDAHPHTHAPPLRPPTQPSTHPPVMMSRFWRLWLLENEELLSTIFSSSSISSAWAEKKVGAGQRGLRGGARRPSPPCQLASTRTHTLALSHAGTRTRTCTHTHSHSLSCGHTRTHTLTLSHAGTRTCTRTCTLAHPPAGLPS